MFCDLPSNFSLKRQRQTGTLNSLPFRPMGGSSLPRFVSNIFRMFFDVWRAYTQRLVPMMAAGLAFYFLLGLIPFLFITTALAGYVFRQRPDTLVNLSTTLLGLLPPGIGDRVMSQVHTAVTGWETFGILGLLSLFFVAMGLFEAIDWGINGAMGTRKKVGFLTGRLLSLAYITGAMVFFTLAAVADYSFHLMLAAPALAEFTETIHVPRRLFATGAFTIFIFVLYMTIPVRTPKVLRAVIVALVVAGIWTMLQKAGATATIHISRRHAVYGALAGGALFLTWMYLLALLLLLGATVLDTWARLSEPRDTQEAETAERDADG